MVPYNYDKQPAAPWSHLTSMQASIVLDQPGNVSFTNLDQISGKVVVRTGKSVDVSGIIVKLEGESRTRLLSPSGPNGEKPKPQLEYHKVRDDILRMPRHHLISVDSFFRYCISRKGYFHAQALCKPTPRWSRNQHILSDRDTMSILSCSRFVTRM